MTERDITGEIRRSSLNRIPALLGIDSDSLKELAERVRQFDKSQSDETRQRKALEKLAVLIGQSTIIESNSDRLDRKHLRVREVEALELTAIAAAFPYEELRELSAFKRLYHRSGHNENTPAVPSETRNQGETRD